MAKLKLKPKKKWVDYKKFKAPKSARSSSVISDTMSMSEGMSNLKPLKKRGRPKKEDSLTAHKTNT